MQTSINKIKNFVSIVVYTENDEDYIKNFLIKMDTILNQNFEKYEFIIVNNFSTDNTIKYVKEIKEEMNSKITIINLAYKHKKDVCMLAGYHMAIGDFILEFENCFIDYNIDEVINIYNLAMEGNDVVIFSPSNKINVFEKVFYKVLKSPFGKYPSISNDKFRIFSRRALNRIYKEDNMNVYRKFRYYNSGLSTKLNHYDTINRDKYKEEKKDICNYINILLKYTNCYLIILYTYLIFLFGCFCKGNIDTNIFIAVNFLFVIFTLITVIRYIKTFSNIDNYKYIYSSIEHL